MKDLDEQNLVWMDLEMTGLNPEVDKVIEIATLVTDKDLKILAEGPVLAISQPEAVLQSMDAWNQQHHGESGLIDRVRQSAVDEMEAVSQTLHFLKDYVPSGISPLCGNTIGQDRRFLRRYMPDLDKYFHYRSVDISTIKELTKRWAPDVLSGFEKKNKHQALDDIRESVEELRFYRQQVFKI